MAMAMTRILRIEESQKDMASWRRGKISLKYRVVLFTDQLALFGGCQF